jgi:uncharacterized membrane protein
MFFIEFILVTAHIFSAGLSLIIGAFVLMNAKGTRRHKNAGTLYFWLMLLSSITALFIYNVNGEWFFPHTLAVATLPVLAAGYWAGRTKKYLRIHIACMVISYYLLIGGAINEAYMRIAWLQPFNNKAAFGATHLAAQFVFIGMLIYYLISVRPKKV